MGAIGYLPNSFKRLYAVCLVEVDEYGGVKRNASTGLGTLVKDGQPGLLLGKLKKGRDFVGYNDSKATNKKICIPHYFLLLLELALDRKS